MTKGLVTVFGGSGFVGTHVVRALVKDGWRVRIATRRPHTALDLKVIGMVGQVQLVQANLRFKTSVVRALEGADAVVNLVGILYETGRQSFNGLHSLGAKTIAEAAKARNITNYVHISSIGADEASESDYQKSKAQGEAAVKAAISEATILRPSLVFGPEDNFFNRFAAMTGLSPALPLIGGGETKFQPVYVGDVAKAVAQVLGQGSDGLVYELGGPQVYSFKDLMNFILVTVDRKRFIAPVPWFAAKIMGFSSELAAKLPFVNPMITRDQVEALRYDNIVSEEVKTLADLGINPKTIEAIVPTYLGRYRKYGQFHEKATD